MLFYLVLIAASPVFIVGLPQNRMVEVDGFFFDGPVATLWSSSSTSTSSVTSTTTSTTTPTATSTTTSTVSAYDACVTSCPVTPEYNPVCGTDRVDYTNPGGLGCAQRCGKNVTLNYYGRCSTRTG